MPSGNMVANRTLLMSAYSPSDLEHQPDMVSCPLYRRKFRRPYITTDICEARFEQSYLELSAFFQLPLCLFSVFEVKIERTWYGLFRTRKFAPSACCQVACNLVALTEVNWELSDNEKKDLQLRKRLRDNFARHLTLLPASLENFVLLYLYESLKNETFRPATVIDDGGVDRLSVALRRVC